MFSYIIGEIIRKDEEGIVLENQGIGYRLSCSKASMVHFQQGERYRVYTFLQVREDALQLYGFYEEEELEMFLLLNRVATIGPKSALGILSALSVETIAQAVLQADISVLSTAPGVGKKTAGRIALELLDPIKKLGYVAGERLPDKPEEEMGDQKEIALQALINLGYPRNEAEKVLRSMESGLSLEDMLRRALQQLS